MFQIAEYTFIINFVLITLTKIKFPIVEIPNNERNTAHCFKLRAQTTMINSF